MIFIDDSLMKVGGVMLPGIVKSLEIKDDAHVEEQSIEGSSRKARQADGYEDAKVAVELILIDSEEQTAEQKLEAIQSLFRRAGQDKPAVHELVNRHTAARRVGKVIFKGLQSRQESKRNQLTATLEFWAYDPVTITAVKSTASAAAAYSSEGLGDDYLSYLSDSRGTAPGKTALSPAVDDAAPPLAALASMPGGVR